MLMMKKMWVMTAVAAAVMALSGCNDNSSQTATAAQAPAKTDVKAGAQAPAKTDVKAGAQAPAKAEKADAKAAEAGKSADTQKAGLAGDDAVAYAVGQSLGSYIEKTNKQQEEFGLKLDPAKIIDGFSDGMNGKDKLQGVDKQKLLSDFDAKLKSKADEAEKKKNAEEIARGEKFLEENAMKEGVKTTESGLQYQVIEPAKDANAPKPDKDSVVKVFYKGSFIDGKVFDQNIGKEPIEFPLTSVIPGWSEGVSLMQKGSKYRFWIPSKLGYGDRPMGQIPANSVLVFEVELVDIKTAEQAKAEEEKKAEAEKKHAEEQKAAAEKSKADEENAKKAEKPAADAKNDGVKPAEPETIKVEDDSGEVPANKKVQ